MEYLRLLKKLIAIKQNKELEMTKEDSLRKDLKQDMKVELQDMKLEIQKILEKFEQLAKQIDKNWKSESWVARFVIKGPKYN